MIIHWEERRWTRRVLRNPGSLLLFLVFVGAILRIGSYRGYMASDEMTYLRAASDMAGGEYHLPSVEDGDHGWLRYTMVVPMAACIWLFGPVDTACAIPFFLVSIAAIIVAYLLGRDLCRSRSCGLFAALILCLSPRDVTFAMRIYPDLIQSFYFALCVWLIVRSKRMQSNNQNSSRFTRCQLLLGLLAGMSFALALNTNIISLFFIPVLFIVTCLIYREKRKLLYILLSMLAGFAILYFPLCLFYWIKTGTPLFEIKAISFSAARRGEQTNPVRLLESYSTTAWHRIWHVIWKGSFYGVLHTLMTKSSYFVLSRAALMCLLIGLAFRQTNSQHRHARIMAVCWLMMLYLALEFGSLFLPLRKMPRYFHMLIFPMAMVVVTTLGHLLNRKNMMKGITFGLFLCVSLYCMFELVRMNISKGIVDLIYSLSVFVMILIVVVLVYSKRQFPKMLGIVLFSVLIFPWQAGLNRGLTPQTQLGRAVQQLNIDSTHPLYTNSWRTKMLLCSFYLHGRGEKSIIVPHSADELIKAVARGYVAVIDSAATSKYGRYSLPQKETQKAVEVFEKHRQKLFRNAAYKIYCRKFIKLE